MSLETEKRILNSMRQMAWSRAKGELNSMLDTFYNDMESFERLEAEIDNFIKNVENLGLQE